MTPQERKDFLKSHRLAIVGAEGMAAPPQLSPVYYVMDGDDVLISTTETRAKARAIRRDPRVSVCVLGEEPPFPYLTIYGHGQIEQDGAVEVMMRIGEAMTGNPVPESARPAVEERARIEWRVVLRVKPQSYFP